MSGTQLHSSPFDNLAELIFRPTAGEDDGSPILLGCLGRPPRPVGLTLGQLRRSVLAVAQRLEPLGIAPGDTVCLLRLPRTGELPAAALYLALSAAGVRVLFPMYLELDALDGWLDAVGATALLTAPPEDNEPDRALARQLALTAARAGVRRCCFETDLELTALLTDPPVPRLDPEALARRGSAEAECLLLTTSGSSGRSKIVRYRQGALLRSCVAWEAAGLFDPDRLGGRGLSLLLAHSMGLRGLWNAVWTRQPLCLITPEWFLEHPERVSALLLSMQPQHVTGGPATFHTLLEFARVFPQLKERCFRSLRCLVSSGAPFDPDLARRVETAFGLPLHNAFGMTETMQALSTLVPGPYGRAPGSLGNPLPGVRLRLDGETADGPRRLRIASPFGCSGYLGDDDPWLDEDGFFSTGDLVELRDGELRYLGREDDDFINDGLGLKLSRQRLEQLYGELGFGVDGLAFVPLRREPGLAALVFVDGAPAGEPLTAPHRLAAIQALLEQRLERLHDRLEELEFRHLAVGRFAAVGAPAPRTVKGNLRYPEIARRHGPLLARLTGRYTKQPGIVLVDRERFARGAAVRLTAPRMGELLRLLELDRHYIRGEGDRLWYRDGDVEREVVDFVGGYGGNLLGHRHPELVRSLLEAASGPQVPLLDQGSGRPQQGAFARKLALMVGSVTGGSYIVRLGSTGAEAVEIALAHACLEREEAVRRLVRDQRRRVGHLAPRRVREVVDEIHRRVGQRRPRVVALERAYHGHSLAARSVTFSDKTRAPLSAMMGIEPLFVPPGATPADVAALVDAERIELPLLEPDGERAVEGTCWLSSIIAAIAEPIQGEGGVHEVPAPLLDALAGHDFPLILDEIQCGLGRSGRLLASEGVRGDYYLLSKALGGGLVKISATLIDRRRYLPRFDELYASTFAGDALSATVASRVLDLVEEERVPARCRERGEALARAVEAVRRDHPSVIRAVRGRGLLRAVELDGAVADRSFTLRLLRERDLLGAAAASYLLARHGVRVLPTLSAPNVLRLEPSAFVDDGAIARLAAGLDDLCRLLHGADAGGLLAHLVHSESGIVDEGGGPAVPAMSMEIEPPGPEARRVAFILHHVLPERELAMTDPSLRRISSAGRRSLAGRMMRLLHLEPSLAFARNLFDDRVWFAVILIPADVALLETLHRMDYRFLETERLQKAVDLGASLGCACVALGGYTSIIARDGTAVLPPEGVQVTSGNAFTAVVGVRRIVEACARAAIDPAAARVGVVGATGNIGSSLTRRLLAGPWGFGRVTLVGRDRDRLDRLRRELGGAQVEQTIELGGLRRCDVVAIATNTNEPLIYPEHLPTDRPVVIADVSVPSAVSREVPEMENVTVIPLAGTVVVPGAPDLVLSSHTPPGTAFCCAAEAMLLGLEPEATRELRLTGPVDPRSMEVLDRLGDKHGLFAELGEGGFRPVGGR